LREQKKKYLTDIHKIKDKIDTLTVERDSLRKQVGRDS
jgi:hypothetical protein